MSKWISLIVGGATGTIARYLVAGAMFHIFGSDFPYGTLTVNISGCFLLGFFATISADKFYWGLEGRLLLMVGFCGAYTTFSTLILETANLMKDSGLLKAFSNLLISVLIGFCALYIGIWAGERFS